VLPRAAAQYSRWGRIGASRTTLPFAPLLATKPAASSRACSTILSSSDELPDEAEEPADEAPAELPAKLPAMAGAMENAARAQNWISRVMLRNPV
jgi:hypothetical protein